DSAWLHRRAQVPQGSERNVDTGASRRPTGLLAPERSESDHHRAQIRQRCASGSRVGRRVATVQAPRQRTYPEAARPKAPGRNSSLREDLPSWYVVAAFLSMQVPHDAPDDRLDAGPEAVGSLVGSLEQRSGGAVREHRSCGQVDDAVRFHYGAVVEYLKVDGL